MLMMMVMHFLYIFLNLSLEPQEYGLAIEQMGIFITFLLAITASGEHGILQAGCMSFFWYSKFHTLCNKEIKLETNRSDVD